MEIEWCDRRLLARIHRYTAGIPRLINLLCDRALRRWGITTSYYPPTDDITAHLRPNTRAVFCESPGSLTFEIQDIAAIVKAAHGHDNGRGGASACACSCACASAAGPAALPYVSGPPAPEPA